MRLFRSICFGLVLATCASRSRAESPDLDLRAEIAELRKSAVQLVERLDELEAKLDRIELRTRALDPKFNSPQEVFQTFQHAYARQNWSIVARCYSEKAQKDMAKALFIAMLFGEMALEQESEKAEYRRKLDLMLSRHLAGKSKAQAHEPTEKTILLGTAEGTEQLQKLVNRIKDCEVFVADGLALLTTVDQDHGNDVLLDRLVEVKIQGESAEGLLLHPAKERRPITFERSDGEWRIDQHGDQP